MARDIDEYYKFEEDASERGGIHSFRTSEKEYSSYQDYKRNFSGTLNDLRDEESDNDYNISSPIHFDPELFEMDSAEFNESTGSIHIASAQFLGDIEKVVFIKSNEDSPYPFYGEDSNSLSDDILTPERENEGDYPTVYVANNRTDITTPLIQELWSIASEVESQNVIHHKDNIRMTDALIRAVTQVNESSEAYQKALEANSHPVAKGLRMINRQVITPTLKLASNLLFGFKSEKTVEQKILTAIEKQTEFQMKGEVGGRGFFERLSQRGIIGSLVGGVANQFGLLEKAQNREDAKSRGEFVDDRWYTLTGVLGKVVDKISEEDITVRGRNNYGNTDFQDAERSQLKRSVDYITKKYEDFLINRMFIDVNGESDQKFDIEMSESAKFSADRLSVGDVQEILLTDGNAFSESITEFFKNNTIKAEIVSGIDLSNGVFVANDNQPEQQSSLKPSQVFESDSLVASISEQMESLNKTLAGPEIIKSETQSFNDIHDIRSSLEFQNDEFIPSIEKTAQDSFKGQQEFTGTFERYNDLTIEELRDIHSFTKKTYKETEKVRKQGFLRMLMGFGSAVVSGIGSVISTVASVGGAIVAAIGALVGGKFLNSLPEIGRRNRKGPKSKKPSGPIKTDKPHSPVKPKAGTGLNVKTAGAASAAFAAYDIYDTVTDEDLTFKDKSEGVGGAAGAGVGGWGGAVLGAQAGAAIGSIVPFVGNAIGGAAGAIIGGIAGSMIGDAVGTEVGSVVGNIGEALGADDGKPETFTIKMDGPQEDEMTLLDKANAAYAKMPNTSLTDVINDWNGVNQRTKDYATQKLQDTDLTGIATRKTEQIIDMLTPQQGFTIKQGSRFSVPSVEDIKNAHYGVTNEVPSTHKAAFADFTVDDVKGVEELQTPHQKEIERYRRVGMAGPSFESNEPVLRPEELTEAGRRYHGIEPSGIITNEHDEMTVKPAHDQKLIIDAMNNVSDETEKGSEIKSIGSGLMNTVSTFSSDVSESISKSPSMSLGGDVLSALGSITGITSVGDTLSTMTDSVSNAVSEVRGVSPEETSYVKAIGRSIKEGFSSIKEYFDEDDTSISSIQNVASSIDFGGMFEDGALNITKKTEEGNEYLKSIAKVLNDMFSHQKRESLKESSDDNTGALDRFNKMLFGS